MISFSSFTYLYWKRGSRSYLKISSVPQEFFLSSVRPSAVVVKVVTLFEGVVVMEV